MIKNIFKSKATYRCINLTGDTRYVQIRALQSRLLFFK